MESLTHSPRPKSAALLPKSAALLQESIALRSGALIRNGAFLALLVWLLVASAYHGAVSPAGGITGVDFHIFYDAASRLNHGLPLYQTGRDLYVYSPLFALLLRPLAHLPYAEALRAWFLVGAGCLILSAALFARAARLTLLDAAPLGLMLLVGFRSWPATMNFGLGQANFILLALLCGMHWADSVRKPLLVALLIVAAALVKAWVLGLVLYLLLNRQWKPALAAVTGYAAALLLLFGLVGFSEWPKFLAAGAAAARQIAGHQVRQSILGFADLHFHANSLIYPLADSRAVYALFVLACTAAIGWAFWALWRSAPARVPLEQSSYRDRLRFGLAAMSLLLLLPTFEDEYIVYCLPLLWTLLLGPRTERGERAGTEALNIKERLPWLLPSALAVYLVLNHGWPVYPPIAAGYQHGLRSLLVSADFFGVAALWLLAFLGLQFSSRPKPSSLLPEGAVFSAGGPRR